MKKEDTNQSRALVMPPAEKLAELDKLTQDYGAALANSDTPFTNAITLASAMAHLHDLLTPDIMGHIMKMMNSPLGFLTDRTGAPRFAGDTKWKPLYTEEEIKGPLIEATLRGFAPVGNEFNVIAGRFYGAKSGLSRKLKQFPGISEYSDVFSVPKIQTTAAGKTGALVACSARWKLNGIETTIEREFAVKGDDYATSDAYIGKAQRKLYAAVLERLTGQYLPEGEVGEEPPMKEAQATTVSQPKFEEKKKELDVITEAAAKKEDEAGSPNAELLRKLNSQDISERWFIQELRKIDSAVPATAKTVADLPHGLAKSFLDFGLDGVLEKLGWQP